MLGLDYTKARKFCGRNVLRAAQPAIVTAATIGAVLDQVLPQHIENAKAIDELYWFYRGDQPILSRKKEIRSEINNKVVENRAFEVVEFKKGYEFSHPVQYTNAGQSNSAPLDILNTYARLDGKESKDLALAEWRYIAGTSYRLCLPQNADADSAPYFTEALDPRTSGVIYAFGVGQKKICSFSYSKERMADDKWQYRIGAYTDTNYFEWVVPELTTKLATAKTTHDPTKGNGLGLNPIVEYPLNESRIGYVELCYHLFNAINNLGSNRIDAVEQFVQALLVFTNCELPTDEDGNKVVPKTGDAIELKGTQGLPADVKYLIAQLDQQQTQVAKEDLLDAVYEICGIPSRQNRNSGGGDTGQAVVLRNGWGAAEARAKSSEKVFKHSEMEYLRVVLAICRVSGDIGDLSLKDIDVRFTRNRSDNMQVKAQTLQMLLQCGVNPEDAYEYCELFSDPTAVWLKSEAWQKAQTEKEQREAIKSAVESELSKVRTAQADLNTQNNAIASGKDEKLGSVGGIENA